MGQILFGLIRFVCDLLLVTAKLNNNNTEFHWWWWWWVNTHNVVKPTLLVMVELGFDKTLLVMVELGFDNKNNPIWCGTAPGNLVS